ncbi:FAD/NAD(P)-binding protein [Pilimelia columellifera]|uniref:FAD/NAD(P)-binding protein n=1 Tax=Pilimelia columellifera subsp. columellifera TaxID=706583 RepID=A0ABP6AEM2_9ACTN
MGEETIAVIGGGCSGVLVTRELLRNVRRRVVLVDPSPAPGAGLAYGAAGPRHLLNSPGAAMSIDPDDPEHFLRWSATRGRTLAVDEFVERQWFGEYLREALAEELRLRGGRLSIHRATVDDLHPADADTARPSTDDAAGAVSRGVRLLLDDGASLSADRAVLTLGGAAPAWPVVIRPDLRGHPGLVGNPWTTGALSAIPADRPTLLLGAGLTAVDMALTLAGRGQEPIIMMSRHGLLPRAHRPGRAGARPEPWPPRVVGLRRLVRAVREAAAGEGSWRVAVDGLRPHLDDLWQGLDLAEQERFLRHLARWWEAHRHRMAPVVAGQIAALCAEGRLVVRRAAVRGIRADADSGLWVRATDSDVDEPFGAIVNCTGPGRWPAEASSLAGRLAAAGAARPGPFALGMDVDADGAVLDRMGRPHPWLFAVGPARRGRLWETTAAPEIRDQARALANHLDKVD